MSEKIFKGRLVQKHDVEANWKLATNFIPKQGELIIYDIDSTHTYERMKIGDGKTVVSSLPFIESSKAAEATHATSADKATKADTATKADSATKATQDGNGKVIADTYETKTDAAEKLTEAKSYTDSEIAEWVGDKTVASQINNAIAAIPQADLAQTDKTAKDYVKNKPTSEDVMQMFMDMDVVQPMADENGAVYTDTDGKLFIL